MYIEQYHSIRQTFGPTCWDFGVSTGVDLRNKKDTRFVLIVKFLFQFLEGRKGRFGNMGSAGAPLDMLQ